MIEKAVEWLLGDEEARRIFRALQQAEGGASPLELLGFLSKQESWQLKCILGRMLDYGIVVREPNGKFSLTDSGRKLVELERSLGEVKKIG